MSKLLKKCRIENHAHHKRTQMKRICVGSTRAKIFLLQLEKQTEKCPVSITPCARKTIRMCHGSEYTRLRRFDPSRGLEKLEFESI